MTLALALAWGAILIIGWLGWQLLLQNGRLMLRLEEIENRLDELEFGDPSSSRREETLSEESEIRNSKSEIDQSPVTSAATDGDGGARENRFGRRSLARSKIKRDGLKAGTPAPDFRLPRLDGRGDLSLDEMRGRPVLLVFSDPHCGPCNALAPELEKFHRSQHPLTPSLSPSEGEREIAVVMISRGEAKENRAKVKEHGLSFPIVLQQQWEISRRYAMFATPIAYLIDEAGVIAQDVAAGTDAIRGLISREERLVPESQAFARS